MAHQVQLWQAIASSDAAGTERALAKGADVNCRGAGGLAPLMAAVERGHMPTVTLLLRHRAEAGVVDSRRRTPLLLAARASAESDEVLVALLDAQASLHGADEEGRSALHEGAACGHEAAVALLLRQRATVDAPTHSGATPLLFAAASGHDRAAMALLRAGASHGASHDGVTPVHAAAAGLHASCVSLLLGAGGTAHSAAGDGTTPLLAALLKARRAGLANGNGGASWAEAMEAATEVASGLLRAAPATASQASGDGAAPLHLACTLAALAPPCAVPWTACDGDPAEGCKGGCQAGAMPLLSLLLDARADPTAAAGGVPALGAAAAAGSAAAARLLMSRGAELEAADSEGRTPLMRAAVRGHAPCAAAPRAARTPPPRLAPARTPLARLSSAGAWRCC